MKEIKCPLQWWEKNETMFPIVGFLACQILGIVGSQIETEMIFSLIGILTNSFTIRKLREINFCEQKIVSPLLTCENLLRQMKIQKKSQNNLKELLKEMKLWIYKLLKNIFKVYFFVKKNNVKKTFPKKNLQFLRSGLSELVKKTGYS